MPPSIETLKEQLLQLKQLQSSGALSQEAYQAAAQPLERALIDAVIAGNAAASPAASTPVGAKPSFKLVGGLTAFVLVFGVGLYLWLGQPQGWNVGPGAPAPEATSAAAPASGQNAPHEMTQAQIAELADHLAKRLEKEPENAEGWAMLARSYAVLNRYPEAAATYKRYLAMRPGDAQAWADYADALGMTQNRSLEGEPARLIDKALAIDPNNFKALALAGSLAFAQKDYPKAARQWEQALKSAPPDSELARGLQGGLQEARQRAGGAAPAPIEPAPAGNAAAAEGGSVSGSVSLAPALAAKAAPDDTVFIFARAVNGPRMPLAIVRKQVRDLPFKFELTDAMAMSPQLKLSGAHEVIVGARISKSGNAMPSPGDLQGLSKPVKVGAADVNIQITDVAP